LRLNYGSYKVVIRSVLPVNGMWITLFLNFVYKILMLLAQVTHSF